jgi:hypothetical protein
MEQLPVLSIWGEECVSTGSRTELGVKWDGRGDAGSKPPPSPAACLRQAGESAAPGNSTAFVWVVRKGVSPAALSPRLFGRIFSGWDGVTRVEIRQKYFREVFLGVGLRVAK